MIFPATSSFWHDLYLILKLDISSAQGIRDLEEMHEYLEVYGYGNPAPTRRTLPSSSTSTRRTSNTSPGSPLTRTRATWTPSTWPWQESIEADGVSTGETFLNTYPFAQELADTTPDDVAVVDVGGGYGHLLREFRARFPDVRGSSR